MAVVPTPHPTSSARCPGCNWARLKSSSVERRPPGWITRLPSTASGILFCRADVQDNEVFTMLQAPKQLGATNRLQRVPRSEIGISELAYLGPSLDRNSAQVAPEVKDLRIVEGITDVSPLPPPEDQADFAQHLQVLTGIGNRHADFGSQTLDGTFAVRKHVQDLEAAPVGERLSQAGELVEERRLGG